MGYFLLTSFFVTMLLTLYLLLNYVINNPKRRLKNRIEKYMLDGKEIFKKPLLIRIVRPILQWTGQKVEQFAPEKYKKKLEGTLLNLGYRYTIQDILLIKLIGVIFVLISTLFYSFVVSYLNPIIPLFISIIVFIIPDIVLSQGLKKKRELMLIELPSFIEQLAVVLEGGISFDNAISKIVQRRKGELINEFHLFIQELKMGSSREEALKKMSLRVQIPEFESLVRALVQGDKMGIGILETIKVQADQIRLKQSQRYREQAMKIPIKLLLPLVIFIFPPILMVILGPAIIHIIMTLL